MESKTKYKFSIDPKLITEVGDNYGDILVRIYRILSENNIRASIGEMDIIESADINEEDFPVCLNVVTSLYSLYPELRKAPMLFVAVDYWTPVATQIKLDYSCDYTEFK